MAGETGAVTSATADVPETSTNRDDDWNSLRPQAIDAGVSVGDRPDAHDQENRTNHEQQSTGHQKESPPDGHRRGTAQRSGLPISRRLLEVPALVVSALIQWRLSFQSLFLEYPTMMFHKTLMVKSRVALRYPGLPTTISAMAYADRNHRVFSRSRDLETR